MYLKLIRTGESTPNKDLAYLTGLACLPRGVGPSQITGKVMMSKASTKEVILVRVSRFLTGNSLHAKRNCTVASFNVATTDFVMAR